MKFLTGLFFLTVLSSCTKKANDSSTDQLTADQLVQRGKSVYNLNCIACHNSDPSKDGSAGPAISGSSKQLLEARILRATYPEAYKSKRESKQMPALPHLEKEIPAIQAFLNSK